MPQTQHTLKKRYTHRVSLDYLQYLPAGCQAGSKQRWPLVLFLHGGGERGSNLEMVKKHGIARLAETNDLPFIALSPQCPANQWWSDYLPALDDLLSLNIESLPVDPARVYLTGLSMGGYGTWHMAVEYPQRFAAIAPICGGGHWAYNLDDRIEEIKHIPVWAFHGMKDRVVPPRESKWLVKRLQKAGGVACLTLYPGVGHDSWTQTYADPALYTWLLSHRRAEG